MARVQRIGKARPSARERRCTMCSHSVQPGEPYKRIEKKTGPRSGHTLFFCVGCEPRPSHLASGRAAELAGIVESISDAISGMAEPTDPDSATIVAEDAAGDIEALADEIREASENMEDGFGHPTTQTENMGETADGLMEWSEAFSALSEEIELDEGEDGLPDWASRLLEILSEEPELNLQG